MEKNETFEYSYSAKQQEEIENIRKKYLPKTEDKMEQLRKLDKSVTQKGTILSLILGIVGALILGVGMSCCLEWEMYVEGSLIGIVGIAILMTAYPVYKFVSNKEKERLAPKILRLSEELAKK